MNAKIIAKGRTFFLLNILLFLSLWASAQKIVFSEEYNLKNATAESVGSTKIVEDSITKEKLLIFSGKKELIFYMFSPEWKLMDRMVKGYEKGTSFNNDFFNFFWPIVKFVHDKKKWTLIISTGLQYTKESIDFATQSHVVDSRYFEDMAKDNFGKPFSYGNESYVLYPGKNDVVNLSCFTSDLTVKNARLDMASDLPVSKSKKFSTKDLYDMVWPVDSSNMQFPVTTQRKVHLYMQPETFAILVANDEPVAELSLYDKQSGKRIKRQLFSAMGQEEAKGKDFNTSALFYDNKVHLLAAHKNGGVYAIFDAGSGKELYRNVYSEKDKNPGFNYGPVTYETIPGVVTGVSKTKEKVEPISMDKFCTELFKHSCAITAKRMTDGKLVIQLCNYDEKQLIASGSMMRNGVNTMTSSDWYISTSAGLVFEPGTLQVSDRKTTWNEVNESKATGKYRKIDYERIDGEFSEKKARPMNVEIFGDKYYVTYYYEKQLKIAEMKLD